MRIDHINIVCSDIDKSKEFYINVIGLHDIFKVDLEGKWLESLTSFNQPKAKCIFLQPESKNCTIELLEYQNPKTLITNPHVQTLNTEGIRHIAFEVDDIFKVYEKALNHGVEFISKPIQVPLDIVPRGKLLCYLKAPDNVILELAQYKN